MKNTATAELLRLVFDALPSLLFVVDKDVRIQDYNAAASALLMADRPTVIKQRAGEVLHCMHSREVPGGCGHAPFCVSCVVRNSVMAAFQGQRVVRRRTKLELIREGNKTEIYALITASPFFYEGRSLALLVIEDISEIAEIRRIIPVCSVCRKVRDDKESWMRVEAYFKDNWDVDFSHGLCPDCYKREMDQLDAGDSKSKAPD